MTDLTTIFHHLQRQLFPALEAELGTLSALDQHFCEVISLTDLDRFARRYEWCGNGAPPCPRTWLARAAGRAASASLIGSRARRLWTRGWRVMETSLSADWKDPTTGKSFLVL